LRGDGLVRNLSRSGWRIEGNHVLAPGTMLTLALSCSGDSVPVTVEKAIVRWVKAHAFGIRIIVMQPADAARLRRFVTRLEQAGLCPPDSLRFTPRRRADPPTPES
jgi:hypothetical protein